jgi:hypothetical protein
MNTEIEILKEHFGSYQAVAEQLGITERHLLNARKNTKIGEPLRRLLKTLVQTLKKEQAGA